MRCVIDKARPFVVTSDYRPRQDTLESTHLRSQLSDQPAQMALWA